MGWSSYLHTSTITTWEDFIGIGNFGPLFVCGTDDGWHWHILVLHCDITAGHDVLVILPSVVHGSTLRLAMMYAYVG